MTQTMSGTWNAGGTASGADLTDEINKQLASYLSMHRGATRPSYAVQGTMWQSSADEQVYVFNGSTDVLLSAVIGSPAPTRQLLTTGTAATYTTPAGCKAILVRPQGAAGGSGGVAGGGAGTTAVGGAGGAGGYVEKWIVDPDATYTYTVGAAGTGGSAGANAGSAGTDTTFTDGASLTLTAGGGGGGAGHTGTAGSGFAGTPGAAGTASGGDVNIAAEPAPINYILSGVNVSGGARGASSKFGSTTQKLSNGAGASASGYGASPTGAYAAATGSTFAGADGQGGCIEVIEFY